MKYIHNIFLYLTSLSCALTLYGIDGNIGGSGTQNDPFRIEDIKDFHAYCADSSYWAEGLHTRLDTDLDLDPNLPNGILYTQAPIAGDTDTETFNWQGIPFSGSFDGNGHTISNLTINTNGQAAYGLGLFGQVTRTNPGSITDLNLKDVLIEFNLNSRNIGGLIGKSGSFGTNTGDNNVLRNCNVSGQIRNSTTTATSFYIGALIGANNDGLEVTNCHSDIVIDIQHKAVRTGGLAGVLSTQIIRNSSAKGTILINNRANEIGGLSGIHKAFITENCEADMIITTGENSLKIGGLIGRGYPTSYDDIITESYATGQIHTSDDSYEIGGFIGETIRINIRNCYSTGSISVGEDSEYIGGFCGLNGDEEYSSYLCIIIKSIANVSIVAGRGANNLGGFCGTNIFQYDNTFPNDPFPQETTYSPTYNYFEDCYALGTITLYADNTNIGGFSGSNLNPEYDDFITYRDCYWSSDQAKTVLDSAGGEEIPDMLTTWEVADLYWDFNTIWLQHPENNTVLLQNLDNDGDTLTNIEEFNFGSDPLAPDTDFDGQDDFFEQVAGTDATRASSRFQISLGGLTTLSATPVDNSKTYTLYWTSTLNAETWDTLTITPSIIDGVGSFALPDLSQAPHNVPTGTPVFFKLGIENNL